LPPSAWKNQLPPRKPRIQGKGESRICGTLLGQATLPVAFYAKTFGLILTLLFPEVNEINYLLTVAG
jgi:hypothetical protein